MKLTEILERKNSYKYMYDIALKYHGLGWVVLISYHKTSGKFLFRMDGGSSGWDRQANYKKYENFNPINNEINNPINNQINNQIEKNASNYSYDTLYTFEQVMSIINSDN